ncbi:hypothetical protein [Paraburkholderia xenovorans]|uniref:hypothetical protein n=1 Tax=Paraburkholderia xenovorans TaxID=36873 RepID=UPI0015C550FA|nr:hypothetical protein [Paraburkholderia xenovorans]NPT38553.1 hypothetical protein [Paraburkholderia xenovorans]
MKIEHFKGIDEAGNTYQVVAYRTVIHDGNPPIYSLPDFRLSDGRSLTPAEDGNRVFKIVQTGVVITLI